MVERLGFDRFPPTLIGLPNGANGRLMTLIPLSFSLIQNPGPGRGKLVSQSLSPAFASRSFRPPLVVCHMDIQHGLQAGLTQYLPLVFFRLLTRPRYLP